jgi:PiT family inorganic phosphate transporter
MASPATLPQPSALDEKLKKSSPGKAGMLVFGAMLIGGLGYITSQLWGDLSVVHNAVCAAGVGAVDRARV